VGDPVTSSCLITSLISSVGGVPPNRHRHHAAASGQPFTTTTPTFSEYPSVTDDRHQVVTAEDLDTTPEQVRVRYPDATEYVTLDRRPCWRRDELRDHEGRKP
jgi:hypothetical protein